MTSKSAAPPESSQASGKISSARSSASLGGRLDRLLGCHRTPLGRRRELLAEAADELVDPGGGGRIALGEDAREVGECLGRAVPERDRLLDLERERDPAVRDAAPVLDRHEREEAQELAGAP